mgnify:CR=1 FL=1
MIDGDMKIERVDGGAHRCGCAHSVAGGGEDRAHGCAHVAVVVDDEHRRVRRGGRRRPWERGLLTIGLHGRQDDGEARPAAERALDLDVAADDPAFVAALAELAGVTTRVRVLGSYLRAAD